MRSKDAWANWGARTGRSRYGTAMTDTFASRPCQVTALAASQVAVEGRTVTFTLLGESNFRYTVTAPSVEGSYAFSGVIKGVNRAAAAARPAPYANADIHSHSHSHTYTNIRVHSHGAAALD